MTTFDEIKLSIMADSINADYTSRGISPLFKASREARIAIVGQAPGRVAEETQLFWNDASGDRLRDWLGLSRDEFYHTERIAQLPMDFYFPGKGKHGDLPPRKGFAEKWHPMLLDEMPNIQTIVLIGSYSQKYYLGNRRKENLTKTVKSFNTYLPEFLPLVHPSPLNFNWFKTNPWFQEEVLPVLKELVADALR